MDLCAQQHNIHLNIIHLIFFEHIYNVKCNMRSQVWPPQKDRIPFSDPWTDTVASIQTHAAICSIIKQSYKWANTEININLPCPDTGWTTRLCSQIVSRDFLWFATRLEVRVVSVALGDLVTGGQWILSKPSQPRPLLLWENQSISI